MYDASAQTAEPPPSLDGVEKLVASALDALLRTQRPDGHFVFELEADCTIPSEFVLLKHYLGEPEDLELERKIGVYLRRIQGEHGGWPLYHNGAFDISASVKAYFCLKMIGDDIDAPHMVLARNAIRAHGGAMAVNVFTRIQLALYGDMDWNEIPTMPAEIIMLPRWFPITLGRMSYWARTVIVPLLVLMSEKPRARNARGVHVPELFQDVTPAARVSQGANLKKVWVVGFGALDAALKALQPVWPRGLRKRAVARCRDWVVERLNGEDGLGAIYPAMANSVMMFDCLGYAVGADRITRQHHVRRVDVVADHLQAEVGLDAGRDVEGAVVVERPAAVLALDAAQVDADLALQLQVLGLAEVVLQQDELRRDGAVGLQLEHEVTVRPLRLQQGVQGAGDELLHAVEGRRRLGGLGGGVVHDSSSNAFLRRAREGRLSLRRDAAE